MTPSIDNFDFFESQWGVLSIEDKIMEIASAVSLPPQQAILIILAGYASGRLSLKTNARQSLELLKTSMIGRTEDPEDRGDDKGDKKKAAMVCARIYSHIQLDLSDGDLKDLFAVLLTFGPKGAYFAFKAVYKGRVSIETMEQTILTVPEPDRLIFVHQYLQATPGVRLKFGYVFKRILKFLHQRTAVVHFYAWLFDCQKDADPFLNNISPRLRDPRRIMSEDICSPYPGQRITGLKALSMVKGKIPPDLLTHLLANEEIEAVRIAVYNVIEASFVGQYRELCYPILQFFYQREETEALHAFKAMVVTGKLPLHRLLKMISAKKPSLLGAIHTEISALSKFSFLVIQDIALNPEEYLDEALGANLACVLGMIKKRPERIVSIFHTSEGSRDEVLFMEKANSLLTREKESILTECDPAIGLMERRIKNQTPSEQAAVRKKLSGLKSMKSPGAGSLFENDIIRNADLSGSGFYSGRLLFNNSVLFRSNLSKTDFSNTVFRKCTLYHVDLRQARFDRVNFDNAVFINVNAEGAEFKNCSFENTIIHNCNFSRADLRDAPLTGARVSKTTFSETDLSDACFAHARISAVNFSNAVLNNADFSDVRARFCKFQVNDNFNIKTDNLDFNARKFQLDSRDMPGMHTDTVAKINQQIFCEFIHYGEKKFLRQNRLSLLTALDIFKPDQADLFQLIPYLLHENVTMPGSRPINAKTPCGIWNYLPDPETLTILRHYIPEIECSAGRRQNHQIEGLFTIGSVGSIAQTSESDIDYWVCIHENRFSDPEMDLLRQKLNALEKIALETYHTKVTFFLVDILKARNNDFGESSLESSGSAQFRLLKEEFYRTMIYVAGKIPLWAVLPSAVSVNYYDSIRNTVVLAPSTSRYIDLGDINGIPTGEYFGGSIWQMFKCLKSPFKSVLKMALLEKFIYEYGKEILLCNKYKNQWMNSGAHLKLAQNDSYYILVENLVSYFESVGNKEAVTLLLTCFYLKLGICDDSQAEDTVFGLRKILLEKTMRQWNWTKDEIFRVGRFKTWDYAEVAALSTAIKDYMVKTYKTVSKRFSTQNHNQSKISPEDRTVLGRKVFIEFSKQPGRVEKTFIISRNDGYYQRLHLSYIKNNGKKGGWELFNKDIKEQGFKKEVLIQAATIEEIGIWMISNGLYNKNNPIQLVPNPTYVTFDDIRRLYKAMHAFFNPPLEWHISFDQLLTPSQVIGLFVSLNFYVSEPEKKIQDYTLVYLNSWGELFYVTGTSDKQGMTMSEVKKDILNRMGLTALPYNTVFYSSKERKKNKIPPPGDWRMLELLYL
ncbi:MAG: class I adenylate cyclase [Proteobacteria bacterium]|nr:class I adenylate cyclase [Pseudomonadota bacterium]